MRPRALASNLTPKEDQDEGSGLSRVLVAVSFCHLLVDIVQSLVPSMYPLLKSSFELNFAQIGLISLAYQLTASLLQPLVGHFTDRRPLRFSLPFSMAFTVTGIFMLSLASVFPALLFAASLIGVGSAVFHPEASRVARLVSGGRHGLAQAFFQMGGNAGSAIGPLLAAIIVLPRGQIGAVWFSIAPLAGMVILFKISHWYKRRLDNSRRESTRPRRQFHQLPRHRVYLAFVVLMVLTFSKYFYLASFTSFYIFYLMDKFNLSVKSAQLHLFVFLGAAAVGTLIGGQVGDRLGRKTVIWSSILGVLPFSLILPSANLLWTGILSIVIGLVISSAFSAILVYAHDLIPGRVGMISGLFFGIAFGMGGIGAAVLGQIADSTNIEHVFRMCAFLPALGLLAALLPNLRNLAGDEPVPPVSRTRLQGETELSGDL